MFIVTLPLTGLTTKSLNTPWKPSQNSLILHMKSSLNWMKSGWRTLMGNRGGEISLRGGTFFFVLRLLFLLSRHGYVCWLSCSLSLSLSSYKGKVTDYNFGCLIRSDARGEYGEQNTIFGELLSSIIDILHAKLWSIFPVTRIQVCLSCIYLIFLPWETEYVVFIVLCFRSTSFPSVLLMWYW